MQTPIQAHAASQAQEAEAEAPSMGADVLLNGLLIAQIWGHIGAHDKRRLRAVARGVKALADGLVVTVTRPPGTGGLIQRPCLCALDLAWSMSGAPLARLRALSLLYTGDGRRWSVPLSQTAAAALEELELHCVWPHPKRGGCLLSIEAVRGGYQLRKLSLHGFTISSLGPLAGCVHLEELSTCDSYGSSISDLTLLGGCAKLKKLILTDSKVSDLATPAGLCRAPGPQNQHVTSPAESRRTTGVQQAGASQLVQRSGSGEPCSPICMHPAANGQFEPLHKRDEFSAARGMCTAKRAET